MLTIMHNFYKLNVIDLHNGNSVRMFSQFHIGQEERQIVTNLKHEWHNAKS